MTPSGFFVVVEGPEGAGKSTLAAALADRIRLSGVEPVVVREPGGTPVAEAIRRELLDPERHWRPEAELLYFATARADLVHRVVQPALDVGRIVLSDRYALSTEAYQVAGRGLSPDFVGHFNSAATGGLQPNLTLILDIPSDLGEARQRAAGKAQDRLDRESREFHRRVEQYYRSSGGEHIRHLDATLPPEQVLRQAWEELRRARPESFGAFPG